MAKKTHSKKKRNWFSSTLVILILAFIIVVALGFWRFGTVDTFDSMLKYAIGATATGIFIAILGIIFRKPLGNLIKNIMK